MLDKVLLKFSENPADSFTINDAVNGVSIIGEASNSVMTSSGKSLAIQYLKQGWGGVVLCSKTDDATIWKAYCKETGREDDLIVFSSGSKHLNGNHVGERIVFNPLDYEMKRAGGAFNLTNIFMNSYYIGNQVVRERDTPDDRYWDTSLRRLINRVIELVHLAGEELSYKNMVKILSSSDTVNEERYLHKLLELKKSNDLSIIENEENYCLKCILKAYSLFFNHEPQETTESVSSFELAYEYFLCILPSLSIKTKSVITESFMSLVEPFLSGILSKHFSGKTNVFPEWAYEQNKVIVLDFPFTDFPGIGVLAQSIFKLLFQFAVERRDMHIYPNPVFLWANDAQYFLNHYEREFLSNSRQSRTAVLFLAQSIQDYNFAMRSNQYANSNLDSLMGNLSTKIFHANSDSVTNHYASNLIGEDIQLKDNSSGSFLPFKTNQAIRFLCPQVLPKEFTMLKTGGKENDFIVDAIVFMTGKKWSTGANFIGASFKQSFG